MNLENKFIRNEIFSGNIDICILVSQGKHYFILDNKENYVIDIRPFYKDYLDNGLINQEQYEYACSNYRGGALILTPQSLDLYLSSLEIPHIDIYTMKNLFIGNNSINDLRKLYNYIEEYLMSSNDKIQNNLWNELELWLPRFYINLDRKIFMHTDWDRQFEDSLPNGWRGKASSQFWSLIPDKYHYWNIQGLNFWKLYG